MEHVTVAYARLLWLKELALWRMAGKRIAMTFYGDDIRRLDLTEPRNPNSHVALASMRDEFRRRDPWKQHLAARLERHGVLIFATNPDLLPALPPQARFLAYGHVNPYTQPSLPPQFEGPLRFVHMPTDRDIKGTSQFLAAIAQLQSEGEACSLTLVEGQSNERALAELRHHDVLLDQLRAGWYGGVAVEAMAMSKPAVAWINPADKALTPEAFARDMPLIEASPDTLLDTLRRIVRMPRNELVDIGLQSRRFTQNWHDPARIAGEVHSAYLDGPKH
jgi:hypothetical protein